MISMKDNHIRLNLDDNARITWLEDLSSANGNIIAEPRSLFRAAISQYKISRSGLLRRGFEAR